jgi:hypothetical protein
VIGVILQGILIVGLTLFLVINKEGAIDFMMSQAEITDMRKNNNQMTG